MRHLVYALAGLTVVSDSTAVPTVASAVGSTVELYKRKLNYRFNSWYTRQLMRMVISSRYQCNSVLSCWQKPHWHHTQAVRGNFEISVYSLQVTAKISQHWT